MGDNNKHGFTLIEVMLFFGISGLMMFGILAGTSTAINQQRYRDSVTSAAAFLQQQYSDVANVYNDRSANYTCTASSVTETDSPAVQRGSSEQCVVLGKLIRANGDRLESWTVIGADTGDEELNDLAAVEATAPFVIDLNQQSYPLEWGARLVRADNPPGNEPANFAVLIVRSPLSGGIRTIVSNDPNATSLSPREIIKSADPNGQAAYFCVDADGLFTGPRTRVGIEANAASGTGVKLSQSEDC